MICLSCKQQIPDDSSRCPNCGAEIFPKDQLVKEIGFRRYQRWIFYFLFVLAFAGAIGVVLKIYDINTKLLTAMADTQANLTKKQADLAKAQTDLAALQKIQDDLTSQNKTVSDSLKAQIEAAQKAVDEKTVLQNQLGQAAGDLSSLKARTKNICEAAVGISLNDLNKILLADAVYGGPDADGDSLSDELEAVFGTSATSTDTDADGYADRAELVSGFNPLVAGGKLPLDLKFAAAQKGKLFVNAASGTLWYIGADAKKYYLGKCEG